MSTRSSPSRSRLACSDATTPSLLKSQKGFTGGVFLKIGSPSTRSPGSGGASALRIRPTFVEMTAPVRSVPARAWPSRVSASPIP